MERSFVWISKKLENLPHFHISVTLLSKEVLDCCEKSEVVDRKKAKNLSDLLNPPESETVFNEFLSLSRKFPVLLLRAFCESNLKTKERCFVLYGICGSRRI